MIRLSILIFVNLCVFSIATDEKAEQTASCTNTTKLLIAQQQRISQIFLCPPSILQPLRNTPGIGGLAYDALHDRMYWSEMQTGSIVAKNLSGGPSFDILSLSPDQWRPRDIALDYVANNMYVLDSIGKKIHVIDLNTKLRTVISDGQLERPTDIAIDPEEAVIIVADKTRILRLNMDGSELTDIVSDPKYLIKALTIDPAHKRIFWSEQNYHRIKSGAYDGSQVSVRIKNQNDGRNNLLGPAQVAYYDDSLYYYDDVYRSISVLGGIDSGKYVQPAFLYGKVTLRRMMILYPGLQSVKAGNPCDGAGCEQLCLIAKKVQGKIVSKCACEVGKKLADDGKKCL